ncbi:MAG: Tetratricopeptide 2 repeat protein, partial [Acidobacteria bacterium]|nr:Tetratricopeptide 2 repeat protein [Acidobacteriota bacterium]
SARTLEIREAGDARAVRVILEASGLRLGRSDRVPFPPFWTLELMPDGSSWHLRSAMTTAKEVALAVIGGPPGQRQALLDCDRGVIPLEVATKLADIISTDPTPGRGTEPVSRAQRAELARWAIDVTQQSADPVSESFCDRMMATLVRVDDPKASMAYARRAVELGRQTGDADATAGGLFSVGITAWFGNDSDLALENLDAAAALFERLHDVRIGMRSLSMAGHISMMRGDLRTAMLRAQRLADASRQVGWTEGEAVAAFEMANISCDLGDEEISDRRYAEAFDLATVAHNEQMQMMARLDLALSRLSQQRYEDAVALVRPTIGFRFLGPEHRILLDVVYGDALRHLHRYDQAEEILQKAVAGARKTEDGVVAANAFSTMAELQLDRHRPTEALNYSVEALRRVVEGGRIFGDGSTWSLHYTSARALRQLGRLEEARTAYLTAIAALESQHQDTPSDATSIAHLFEQMVQPYAELSDLLLGRGQSRQALLIAEQMKARSLRDVLERGKIDVTAAMSSEEKKREEELESRVSDLNRHRLQTRGVESAKLSAQLTRARGEMAQFHQALFLAHPDLRARRVHEDGGIDLPLQLRNTAVVEYVVGEQRTLAFVITRDDQGRTKVASSIVPISRAALTSRVDRFAAQIEARDLMYGREARALYDLLLAPLAPQILSRRTVCIVPDGELWRLPFQVLRLPSGQHLIEHSPVYYAPSVATIRLQHERPRGPSPASVLLAFGNPTIGSSTIDRVHASLRSASLGSLPEAEAEVRALESMYGRSRSEIFVGKEARESIFKREAPHYRILHIATHGILDDRAPMYSALVMASSPAARDDDGLLEAREISDLVLHADVAVLSACETARGRIGAGEGVVGMSWALMAAGCPTTVVSQWSAASGSTEGLMIEFHRQLLAGQRPAEALRAASLATRKNPRYAHPFYWATFVVVGAN